MLTAAFPPRNCMRPCVRHVHGAVRFSDGLHNGMAYSDADNAHDHDALAQMQRQCRAFGFPNAAAAAAAAAAPAP